MLLNKFSVFLVFISLLGTMISCDVDEEDTNEVFQWEHVQGSGLGATIINYNSPSYSISKTPTNLKIIGYPNNQDSLIINLGNLEGHELTIGNYKLGLNNFFNLSFFKNGAVYNATEGYVNVSYLNNRIDFDFDVDLSNGTRLESGLADNLLLNNVDTPGTVAPPVQEIGTIEATINGAKFLWDKSECIATFNSTPKYLNIAGTAVSNNITMAFANIDSPAKLASKVGQTVQLGTSEYLINYVTTGGVTSGYGATSGQVHFVSFDNNILTLTFQGEFTNILDPNDKIPFTQGEVKAILVN